MVVSSTPVAVTLTSDTAPVLSKKFLDIHTTIEHGFTMKHVHDMIIIYSHYQHYHTYVLHILNRYYLCNKDN